MISIHFITIWITTIDCFEICCTSVVCTIIEQHLIQLFIVVVVVVGRSCRWHSSCNSNKTYYYYVHPIQLKWIILISYMSIIIFISELKKYMVHFDNNIKKTFSQTGIDFVFILMIHVNEQHLLQITVQAFELIRCSCCCSNDNKIVCFE